MLDRRRFMAGLAGAAIAAGTGAAMAAGTASARGQVLSGFETAALRGAIDAAEFGVRPHGFDDQSRAFARLLAAAAGRDVPVALPAGTYVVSSITLPRRLVLSGVPGATRIAHGGDGPILVCEGAEHIELSGLVFDGANRGLADGVRASLDLRDVARLVIDGCGFVGSARSALALTRCGGRVTRSTISGAADFGLYSVDATGIEISGNTVSDCGNGGILVHRRSPGEDGTLVTGNRVQRILARDGGTGQVGNGINVFRAGSVMISGNHVSDCAFSAIRSNGGSNLQVTANTCLRSGETAIYSEFAFEGAVIASNIVDGAAKGISIVNFDKGGRLAVCSGNLVRNLAQTGPYESSGAGFGIGITVEADTAVTGNVIEGAPRYGLQLGWGSFLRDVSATGNVIRRAGTGIAVSVVEGAGAAIISGNMISQTPNGAIVGHRWGKPATGDLALAGAAGFAHLTLAANYAG
ncbi:TIGR03808 family TAT-translocated repetitive protein [Aquibium sp. ELW1220]|uniref:TIGR03808 family TAT-translocated repetitive protein n=1 Tax=Aquibium sp. ELW1220 TaxID=2976766 RepID=UPI0025B0CB0E|nr:TIGR03808 family TAT-translocated repetitive protein [Aquibium sp. ELW1220]MDN2583469.1 TIGR03808 family TAT-translocated repetitive protein [Aquibium sp. ELW1220]